MLHQQAMDKDVAPADATQEKTLDGVFKKMLVVARDVAAALEQQAQDVMYETMLNCNRYDFTRFNTFQGAEVEQLQV